MKENSIVLKMILKLMIIILSTDKPEIIFLTALKHKIKGSISGLRQFWQLKANPFKNHEKCFLFHFKSSFHSQDV